VSHRIGSRRALLLTAATLGGAALTAGCGTVKPTPLVTVVNGHSSANTEASCYSRDGHAVDALNCLKRGEPNVTVAVSSQDRLGIGVDPAVADRGWLVALNNQSTSDVTKKTFLQLSVDPSWFGQTDTAVLNVVSTVPGGKGASGTWNIVLHKVP
jgi:hypothetical protein